MKNLNLKSIKHLNFKYLVNSNVFPFAMLKMYTILLLQMSNVTLVVFIWPPVDGNAGHASLLSPDNTYISHRQGDNIPFTRSFKDDVIEEKSIPQVYEVSVEGLHSDISWKDHSSIKAYATDCCDLNLEALASCERLWQRMSDDSNVTLKCRQSQNCALHSLEGFQYDIELLAFQLHDQKVSRGVQYVANMFSGKSLEQLY